MPPFPGGCCFLVGGFVERHDQDACASESLFSNMLIDGRCCFLAGAVSRWVYFSKRLIRMPVRVKACLVIYAG